MYVKIIDASVMKENLEENVMSRDELIEKGYGHESAYEVHLHLCSTSMTLPFFFCS